MIRCPICGDDTSVLETRRAPRYARRRRKCNSSRCGAKVTTLEFVLQESNHGIHGDVVLVRRRDIAALIAIAGRLTTLDAITLTPSAETRGRRSRTGDNPLDREP